MIHQSSSGCEEADLPHPHIPSYLSNCGPCKTRENDNALHNVSVDDALPDEANQRLSKWESCARKARIRLVRATWKSYHV